tara:strand:- start:11 stop:337 length:327 start_codon:yes stop_codon:yes gene_type:complete
MAFKMKGAPFQVHKPGHKAKPGEKVVAQGADENDVKADAEYNKRTVKEVGLGGTKEYQDGKPTTKSLKEVRARISKERMELVKSGATAAEIKSFDTYQNKRISELYKG